MNQRQLTHAEPVDEQEIFSLTRPDKNLLQLYVLYALVTMVAFPFVMLPLYFRYRTMRYRFDTEGISVSYGILWRKESYTTYSRIQDIHVTRNILERWLGLGTVDIQTASGSSTAEVCIVGVRQFDNIRDFLYARMRGVKLKGNETNVKSNSSDNEVIETLRKIKEDLNAVRQSLETKRND